ARRAPEIGNEQCAGENGSSGGDEARVACEFFISAQPIGGGADDTGGACGSSDEEVNWNLPGPLWLFEHGDAVISVLCIGYRERRAGKTNAGCYDTPGARGFYADRK